eukprot:12013562-Prorocentrum_lima.AAC.1
MEKHAFSLPSGLHMGCFMPSHVMCSGTPSQSMAWLDPLHRVPGSPWPYTHTANCPWPCYPPMAPLGGR